MKYFLIVLLTIASAFYCRGQDTYILQFNKDFDELLHKQKNFSGKSIYKIISKVYSKNTNIERPIKNF